MLNAFFPRKIPRKNLRIVFCCKMISESPWTSENQRRPDRSSIWRVRSIFPRPFFSQFSIFANFRRFSQFWLISVKTRPWPPTTINAKMSKIWILVKSDLKHPQSIIESHLEGFRGDWDRLGSPNWHTYFSWFSHILGYFGLFEYLALNFLYLETIFQPKKSITQLQNELKIFFHERYSKLFKMVFL